MPRTKREHQIHNLTPIAECADQIVHLDAVVEAQKSMPGPSQVQAMTELFAALAVPSRLRIVAALAGGELCVCDLAATVGMSQSATSHQLRMLRKLGLVRPRRQGRMMYYALDDEHVSTLYDQALEHVNHAEVART